MTQPLTLFDKIWAQHEILKAENGLSLLWVDRHYVHEGSFQGFDKVEARNAKVARPDLTFGIADHYVPTARGRVFNDPSLKRMVEQLTENTGKHGVMLMGMNDPRQGIVHVVGPEQGLTIPGLIIVCGDSHTATHGALGAIAIGIGASEVSHVLLTQTFWQKKPNRMRVTVDGQCGPGIGAKDIALSIIAKIGTNGAQGHAVEYAGRAIRALTQEGRLTLCNLAIEAGARTGMVAPDETTFAYVKGRPFAPKGADFDRAVEVWQRLPSDTDAEFDREVSLDAAAIAPGGDLGHQPGGHAADRCRGARSRAGDRSRQGKADAGRARLHGALAAPEADRHPRRPRVHRFVHQCAHRGFARGRGRPRRAARRRCRALSRPAPRR